VTALAYNIFRVSQTEGDALPTPPQPRQLDGNDPLGDELFFRLHDFLDDLAITVERAELGRRNGMYAPLAGKIYPGLFINRGCVSVPVLPYRHCTPEPQSRSRTEG